ncbi:MAG: hypothetical protein EZS28_042630, partial [Streblomastix strix]
GFNPILVPSNLKDTGSYSGKLQLLGAGEVVLGQYDVVLQKDLPKTFPDGYTVASVTTTTSNRITDGGDYRFYVNPTYYGKDGNADTDIAASVTKDNVGGAYILLSSIFTISAPATSEDPLAFSLTVNQGREGQKTLAGTRTNLSSNKLIVKNPSYSDIETNVDYIAEVTYNYGPIYADGSDYKLPWSSYNSPRILVTFNPNLLYDYRAVVVTDPGVTKNSDGKFIFGTQLRLQQRLNFSGDNSGDWKNVPTASYRKFYTLGAITLTKTAASGDAAAAEVNYLDASKESIDGLTSLEPGANSFPLLALYNVITIPATTYSDDAGLITLTSNAIPDWGTTIDELYKAIKTGTDTSSGTDKAKIRYVSLPYKVEIFVQDAISSEPTKHDLSEVYKEAPKSIDLLIDQSLLFGVIS